MCLAVPATITNIEDIHAMVDIMGVKKRINIQLLKAPKPGDYVLVHAGFAIQKIHPNEFTFLKTSLTEMIGEGAKEDEKDEYTGH